MIRLGVVFFLLIYSSYSYAVIINKEKPVYYYTNNSKQIEELKEKLRVGGTVGVTGISGIGKSELVRRYVEKYSKEYEIVAFFDTNTDLSPQFIALAKEINAQICPKEQCVKEGVNFAKESVIDYLKNKDKWLLIFDNLHINENHKVKDIIELRHNGHIIICSQDDKYLLQKIPVPFLNSEHTRELISKIITKPSYKFSTKLIDELKGYPTYVLAHSVIFLQNNNHMTIEEYVNYMKNNENKTREHLNIVLGQVSAQTKETLFKLALLNNQRIPRWLIEETVIDKEPLSSVLHEIIRFGLMELISEDRDDQVFRIHDAVKNELLALAGEEVNRNNIDYMVATLHNAMPNKMVNKFFKIGNDLDFENNLEILLSNGDKYKADILKTMELKNDLLGYYLRSREPLKAKKAIDWFRANKDKFNTQYMSAEEKVSYSRYLGRIGRYEYFTANQPAEVAMGYLKEAKSVIDTLSGNESAKTAIYYEAFQIQIFTGDIQAAKDNLEIIEKIMIENPQLSYKDSMIDYGKARIFLAQGKYEQALSAITLMLDKELLQLKKSKEDYDYTKAEVALEQESAWLAPIYILKAEILNYLQEFHAAHDISKKVYDIIRNKSIADITSSTLAYTLTELSRAELGLKLKDEALKHADEAVNILIGDEERSNREIDDSTDVFLAPALVAKGEALNALDKLKDAVDNYKAAKNIYWNIYGSTYSKQMDNVSYLLVCTAKAYHNMSSETAEHKKCDYYYQLHIKFFGNDHPRSLQLKNICS